MQKKSNSLDKQLEDNSIRYLILDLKNLHFMDSSGIGVFIGRYKAITKRGGRVCITISIRNWTEFWKYPGFGEY